MNKYNRKKSTTVWIKINLVNLWAELKNPRKNQTEKWINWMEICIAYSEWFRPQNKWNKNIDLNKSRVLQYMRYKPVFWYSFQFGHI